MTLRARLSRLEKQAPPPAPQEGPDSLRWLQVLQVFADACRRSGPADEADRIDEALATLRGYRDRGVVGAHVEYHCGCSLSVCSAWYRARPGDPWHGQPWPFPDEAAKLRQADQIDRWRAMACAAATASLEAS
jgi:hypothetical protein